MEKFGIRMHVEDLPRRLDKFVREASRLSLAEVREALGAGLVHCARLGPRGSPLDGRSLIFSDDVVRLQGQRLKRTMNHATIVLNKPASVTSTTRDPRGKRDLSRYMKDMPKGVFPVGRLDRATTGALLFTTDGDLASAVLRPEHALEKEYWLWLNEPLDPSDPRLAQLVDGVPVLGAMARASRVSLISRSEDMAELLVYLREGKNRQIRRMCRALDLRLLHLHRRAIGPIRVDDLPLGHQRALEPHEVDSLYAAVGGRDSIVARQCDALEAMAAELRAEGRADLYLESWLEGYRSTRIVESQSARAACTRP